MQFAITKIEVKAVQQSATLLEQPQQNVLIIY